MSPHDTEPLAAPMSTARVEAFSDGVFAIAATLLVLELRMPELPAEAVARGALAAEVVHEWPKLVSYVISFSIVGFFWVGHHLMFHYVRRTDRNFLFLNNVFLMLVAFMPYPSDLLGRYGGTRLAVTLYGGTLVAIGLVYVGLWRYATGRHRLVDSELSPRLIRRVSAIILAAPIVNALAVGVGLIQPRASLVLFLLVPLSYIVPGPVNRMMRMREAPARPRARRAG
ncbi:MAG TPA: TMEM175 family protein [Candidatus Eisenbacteria bacterium]|nr:TMEM175 family protein [Candidatus Eisenbacteria bacterium]